MSIQQRSFYYNQLRKQGVEPNAAAINVIRFSAENRDYPSYFIQCFNHLRNRNINFFIVKGDEEVSKNALIAFSQSGRFI